MSMYARICLFRYVGMCVCMGHKSVFAVKYGVMKRQRERIVRPRENQGVGWFCSPIVASWANRTTEIVGQANSLYPTLTLMARKRWHTSSRIHLHSFGSKKNTYRYNRTTRSSIGMWLYCCIYRLRIFAIRTPFEWISFGIFGNGPPRDYRFQPIPFAHLRICKTGNIRIRKYVFNTLRSRAKDWITKPSLRRSMTSMTRDEFFQVI